MVLVVLDQSAFIENSNWDSNLNDVQFSDDMPGVCLKYVQYCDPHKKKNPPKQSKVIGFLVNISSKKVQMSTPK